VKLLQRNIGTRFYVTRGRTESSAPLKKWLEERPCFGAAHLIFPIKLCINHGIFNRAYHLVDFPTDVRQSTRSYFYMSRPMTIFRYRKDHELPDFDVADFHNLGAAKAFSEALIIRHSYTHVEIDDAGSITRVERPTRDSR